MKIHVHADSQVSLSKANRLKEAARITPGFWMENRLERGVSVDTQEMLGLWSITTPEGPLWRVAIVGVLDGLAYGFEVHYREESDARAVWDHISAEGRKTGVISPGTERDAVDGYLDRAHFMRLPFPTDSKIDSAEAIRLKGLTMQSEDHKYSHKLRRAVSVGTQEMLGLYSLSTPEGPLWWVAIVGVLDGQTREFQVHYREESDARAVWDHIAAEGRKTGLIPPAVTA